MNNQDRSRYENLCRKYGVEPELVDIEAIIDSTLTYWKNKNALIEYLKGIAANGKVIENNLPEKAKTESERQEARILAEEHFLDEQNKALDQITDKSSPEIDRFFDIPIHLVKMLARGYGYAIMFKGQGGIGKTFTILKTLKNEGLKFGEDFAYVRGYSTPLALYKFLYFNRDKKIIILDDVEGCFDDDRGKAVLKAALDNTLGRRFVGYLSTSEKAEDVPSQFEITANIITCANDYPTDADFRALMDRCIYYEFNFRYKEIIRILEEMIKLPYKNLTIEQKKEVYQHILNNSSEATRELSIRTLLKIYEGYLYDQNNGKSGFWQKLAIEILKPDENLVLIKNLMNSGLMVNEQVNGFIEKTGLSRATYFRLKQKVS